MGARVNTNLDIKRFCRFWTSFVKATHALLDLRIELEIKCLGVCFYNSGNFSEKIGRLKSFMLINIWREGGEKSLRVTTSMRVQNELIV